MYFKACVIQSWTSMLNLSLFLATSMAISKQEISRKEEMLDLMSAEEFEGKIVGLVGVAGGHVGAINSLNTLRTIGRNLHCWILPQEVSVADSMKVFNEDGTLTEPAIEQRLLNLGRQVVKFASLQQKIKQDDFMKLWEGLPTW